MTLYDRNMKEFLVAMVIFGVLATCAIVMEGHASDMTEVVSMHE